MLLRRYEYQVMNQNEVDTNCKMFCQTIKCECNTIGLFCFAFIVLSFLPSLKALLKQKRLCHR